MVICTRCSASNLDEGDPGDVTQSICLDCLNQLLIQWDQIPDEPLLEELDAPALLADAGGRVQALNQRMLDFLGKEQEELLGMLGGDVLSCCNASEPGGCGKASGCSGCAIRHALRLAEQTREPCLNVPAYIQTAAGRLNLSISALASQGRMRVLIEIQS